LARRGEAVTRAATPVTVYALELVARGRDTIELELRCSAGTYVRALARDLGERLGTGAHLMALRRTRSGCFDIGQAVPGDQLEGAAGRLVPLSGLLLELPAVVVGEEGQRRIGHGRELGPEHVLSGFPEAPVERVRLLDGSGQLLALAIARGLDESVSALPRVPSLHPDVVLTDGAS
jgi:tRNA pseudouridine55 synthase